MVAFMVWEWSVYYICKCPCVHVCVCLATSVYNEESLLGTSMSVKHCGGLKRAQSNKRHKQSTRMPAFSLMVWPFMLVAIANRGTEKTRFTGEGSTLYN